MNRNDFDQIPIGMFATGPEFRVRIWNICMAGWTKVESAQAIDRLLGELFPAFESPVYRTRIEPVFDGGPPVVFSPHLHGRLYLRPDAGRSSRRHLQTTVSAAEVDGERVALFSVQDVTSEVERSRLLREQSEQRRDLLREHHHRIKNNLTMLASLLNLQKDALYDRRDEQIIDSFAGRLLSIERVHDHLHRERDTFTLELDHYVQDLVSDVLAANATGQTPDVDLRVPPVDLQMVQAIPLGMILAELLINSLKYAIGAAGGTIRIVGRQADGEVLELTYSDSGPGRTVAAEGTGSELNEAFAAQLEGALETRPGPGGVTVLRFPVSVA